MKKYKLLSLITFYLFFNGFLAAQETRNEYLIRKFGLPENAFNIYLSEDSLPMQWSVPTETPGLIKVTIAGKPPSNYRAPIAQPTDNSIYLNNVPAFDWSFGCSATSAAMFAGYYDNMGFSNMYTGPTNGGVMPMNNSSWGTVVINGETRSQCPLSATRKNVDGRTTNGHVDDYWIKYESPDPDPYITGGWTQHDYGDCTGDYMKTNQSEFDLTDGSTRFYSWNGGAPYSGTDEDDGCYGFSLFIESRGYTVTAYYNQLIQGYNGNTQGFTFTQFQQAIDAGNPVLIHVTGHTMLGIGYSTVGNIVYLHDTWDYNLHEMVWGGFYAGMQHESVSVIQLQVALLNTIVLDDPNTTGNYIVSEQITLAPGFTTGNAFSATVWQLNKGKSIKILENENVLSEFEIETDYTSVYPDLWKGLDSSGNKVKNGIYKYMILKDGMKLEEGEVEIK